MLKKINATDIASELDISVRTSQKYFTDIKKHYSLIIVTKAHFYRYFNFITEDCFNSYFK